MSRASEAFLGGARLGIGLGQLAQRKREAQQQNQLQSNQQIQQGLDKSLQISVDTMKAAAKQVEDAKADPNPDPNKIADAQKVYDATRSAVLGSSAEAYKQAVQMGHMSADDAKLRLQRIITAGNVMDIPAQQRIAAQGEQLNATGTQMGKETAISSPTAQSNREADLRRAQALKATPTTQNITQSNLTTAEKTKVQAIAIDSQSRIDRLNKIMSDLQSHEEYLQLPGKAYSAYISAKNFLGLPVDVNEEQFLTNQSKFVRDAIENINLYIKEITGAQMSEAEAKRLRLSQPDPGQSVFSGDSPIKFKAKAESAIDAAKIAQARATYFLNHNIQWDFAGEAAKAQVGGEEKQPPISIDQMKQIMLNRGKEIAIGIRAQNPYMPHDEIVNKAKEMVKKEFGL